MGCGLPEDDRLVRRRSVMETVNRLKEHTKNREKKRGWHDSSPHIPQLVEQELESDGLAVMQSNFISTQLLLECRAFEHAQSTSLWEIFNLVKQAAGLCPSRKIYLTLDTCIKLKNKLSDTYKIIT